MRILHICTGFLDRPLYDKLFYALQSLKIDNDVVALRIQHTNSYPERPYKLKIIDKSFSIFDRVFYFGKQKVINNTTLKLFSINDYDMVHSHTLFSSGYVAFKIYKTTNAPYIVTLRNTDINVFFRYLPHLRFIGRNILSNSSRIIFLSPSYRNKVVTKYFTKEEKAKVLEKSVILPNGIDDVFLDNKPTKVKEVNINNIRLIYIGEIKPNKNIETTIKACKLLISQGYNVRFTIVGEVFRRKYYHLFERYDFISYHENCSKQELIKYLRHSDIFVMPSKLETFGIVYPEAMSQGLPLIYSKGQGFDGHFEDGVVGFRVKCTDSEEIKGRIIELYKNYKTVSSNCIKYSDRFRWSSIAKEYLNMYNEVLKNQRFQN